MSHLVSSIMCFILFGFYSMTDHDKQNPDRGKTAESYRLLREKMVHTQIEDRGVRDTRVLEAMKKVPRHEFVPAGEVEYAYDDNPLPIGYHQTISQPYIVAYMTEALALKGQESVLEIGTGSGYQAAVLAELAQKIYTIEIVEPLCEQARQSLKSLGYQNIFVRCGDGFAGWPECAPFDAIMVTAAPETIPQPLIDQLAVNGRLIAPVGKYIQELVLITKTKEGSIVRTELIPVRFVPMTGKAQQD
jgi:protein-L-isoaspartate(D-aspartate) O-methyltransferase